jgi:hypothetical protein
MCVSTLIGLGLCKPLWEVRSYEPCAVFDDVCRDKDRYALRLD